MPEPADPSPHVETVADRLHRLEQQLAGLRNTDDLEQQLAKRVLDRISHAPPGFAGAAGPDGLAVGPHAIAGVLVPAALRAVLPGTAAGVWARVPVLAELRLMVRMYVDPRYRLSRVAQFGVPLILGLVVLNYFIWSAFIIPLLPFVLERLFFAVLAVALYKVLEREAARYASVLNYLSRYGT